MTSRKPAPPEKTQAPLENIVEPLREPFREFAAAQSASGWFLLAATASAIALANSTWAEAYFELRHLQFGLTLGDAHLTMSLQHWINDGLMGLFFFLLGLELKRELLVGRLSEPRRARSVLGAAIGGMVVPAAFFLSVIDRENAHAWAIPVATDTAFALTVLVLLGKRIPGSARAFLVGLAIVDDLGAILLIAVAYSGDLDLWLVPPSIACIALLAGMNLMGVRSGLAYCAVGVLLWALFMQLGLHGTLAGVTVALAAPVLPAIPRSHFIQRLKRRIASFERAHDKDTSSILEQPEQQEIAQRVRADAQRASPPLTRWETGIEKPVSFIVIPLFAFMNAGFAVSWSDPSESSWGTLNNGILLGLLAGKPLGIFMGLYAAHRFGLADLPAGLTLRHVAGIGFLGGIGFTMSLFIAALSFGEGTALLESARQSIIVTSMLAGIAGYAWLRWACPRDHA